MFRNIFFLVLAAIFCVNCTKIQLPSDKDNSNLQNKYTIQAGFIDGWGMGTDSISISQNGINYVYYVPRESDKPKIIKSKTISNEEWNEILSTVNYKEFSKIDLNECHTCYDGNDEWILIKSDTSSHFIRYAKDVKIESIKNLQNKLAELREEFSK